MDRKRLPEPVAEGLAAGATLICSSAQRQAALRAAWAAYQRSAGLTWWPTPRILTFNQFAENALADVWAVARKPDALLSPSAEWAVLRDWRRDAGGAAEARALLNSVRTVGEWGVSTSAGALGGSPEGELLLGALSRLDELAAQRGRRPLRGWLDDLAPPGHRLIVAGAGSLAAGPRTALERCQAEFLALSPSHARVSVATAEDDDQELELLAGWCRAHLESDPERKLLIVDARLRQRRAAYDRILSQALTPSHWVRREARSQSAVYTIEGGQPLNEFPLVAHALLALRLLTGRLGFDEILTWLRLPFLDGADHLAGAVVEELIRKSRRLEWSALELATWLDREEAPSVAKQLAARLRQAATALGDERHSTSEFSPRILQALRLLGWPGSRPLRSEEQQTVARWQLLLDEFASLGPWMSRVGPREAVATIAELASERQFDPASVEGPITVTESHHDPVVRYDAIWVAGLDAAQWPAPPRPDAFIPLRLQRAAGIPWASARGQALAARQAFAAWRAATADLTCSWARLEGDAHRSVSPMLAQLAPRSPGAIPVTVAPLASLLRPGNLEPIDDSQGRAVDTRRIVAGGVRPLELQSECGFHAYAELRLAARDLESPSPGLDPRDRGKLLHKSLELVWIKLKDHFHLKQSQGIRGSLIADSVEAAVASVYRGQVPAELHSAVAREKHRLEILIEALLQLEQQRPSFEVVALESRREVSIAGGRFELRIDRIDAMEGGGHAILDYKSGEARAPRWDREDLRDPQLLAYLLSELGRNVQALANVSLANGRARFVGRSSRNRMLPGVRGLDSAKLPADDIDRTWQQDLERWLLALTGIAANYIAGVAPVQPATDVCRNCHLTVLCRRVELSQAALLGESGDD